MSGLASLVSTSVPLDVNEADGFNRVTEALLANGATPVLLYLSDPSFAQNIPTLCATSILPVQPVTTTETEQKIPKAVARIHQACQHTFGNSDMLNFEFVEDEMTQGRRCILTITRPNGAAKTYSSPITFGKKYEAKASVCTIAIENGAIDFIYAGESNGGPSNAPPTTDLSTPLEMDESVKAIEQCCLEWAGGSIKPFWLIINEPKVGRTQGCALRIRLGPRNLKVYSANTIYSSPSEARKACAEIALAEGVIDYIKTWSPSNDDMKVEEAEQLSVIGLQQFFESLPQPFPEPVIGRNASDINGPAWLNTTIQSARGAKIVPNFIWTVDPRHNFHGCLLRLERPGEVKSYLVDARFSKRIEAKAAVCLLAMSEGVGDYIRAVGKAVEDKLSPATRRHVSEVLLPTLHAEFRKVRGSGIQPTFDFDMDLDACGATMTIELVPNPSPQQVRKYTVPAEYRNRIDAKFAVILHAIEEGVLEFLRFQGNPPPTGYVRHYAQQDNQYVNRKRKNWDFDGGSDSGLPEWSRHDSYSNSGVGGWQKKKPRVGGFQGNFSGGAHGHGGSYNSAFGQNQFAAQGGGFQHGSKPSWNGQKRQQNWKRHREPGPGPFADGMGGNPHPGQFKPGPRSVGVPSRSGYPYPPGHAIPIAAPSSYSSFVMQPQQSPPAPTAYPANGGNGGLPPQAAFYGVTPQVQQMQTLYNIQPGVAPVPQVAAPYSDVPHPAAPGSAAYPPYVTTQNQPPAPGVQHLQQLQHGIAYTSLPDHSQVVGYQPYPSAQPQPPHYPTPAPTPTLTPVPASSPIPIPISIPTIPTPAPQVAPAYYTGSPTPGVMLNNAQTTTIVSGYASYQSSFRPQASQSAQPPPPQPQTPAVALPPPPAVSPPPPPPPTTAPPPPPPHADLNLIPNQPQSSHPIPMAISPTTPSSNSGDRLTPIDLTKQVKKNDWPSLSKSAKVSVSIESAPRTNVSTLYDYCRNEKLPVPEWCHEIFKGERQGEPKHKVWVVIGKMRFELPVMFSSLSQGQDKIARKVVDQLKTLSHAELVKLVGSKA